MNKRGEDESFFGFNLIPKYKKGSHVEVIVSFVIFITFVIFIFASIKSPITRQEEKNNLFDSIEIGIMKRISADMTMMSITIPAGGGQCITLDNFLEERGIGENIVAKDSSGQKLDASVSGNSLNINRTNVNDNFIKIYYSPEINMLRTGSACTAINPSLWLTKTDSYVFENKFIELLGSDYAALKAYLDVPTGVNFGYGLILSNSTIIERVAENISTNVYIREKPVEYIDLEGNISEGYLKISVW